MSRGSPSGRVSGAETYPLVRARPGALAASGSALGHEPADGALRTEPTREPLERGNHITEPMLQEARA